ncbi:hypothetical protein ERJ75_001246900 [Trypanosoma vivax]|nr:hypothetical protein ERJ75_001246900 [Trypanosoma vivax]
MLVVQLGILLLSFTVPPAVSAKSHANPSCPNKAASANDVQKCVAIDLLWGWLHVVNKTSERLLEVRQNATKIEKGAEELRKEAKAALRNATEILAELNKESDDARTVSEVMKNIRDAIVWANESERNASLAVDATRVAETLARDGYGAVSLGARYFKGWNSVQELKYDALKTKIGEITISKANGCAEVHNVSGVLTDYAEKLNGIATNLTEWKVKMTEIIKTTYNSTQSNKSTCLSLFNHEKVEQVTAAVANLSERLIVAVKQVNTSLLAREKAAANKNMETMTASMMNFLESNGAELCDMLRQREALWTKLSETKQRLKEESQGASTTLVSTAKIKGTTADTDELVRDALKEVEGLSKFSVFSASTESLSSRSVTLAREAMENAMKASEQAAKLSDRTKSRFAFVDEEVESEHEKLKGLENKLKKLSKEAHIDISGGNTNECNGKLVNKLETSTKDLLRSAARLNTSKLLEANRTLGRLAELVVQNNTNVDSISTDVELASRKLKNTREFGHSATMAAESAVTEALEQLMNKLCATAAELRVLRSN